MSWYGPYLHACDQNTHLRRENRALKRSLRSWQLAAVLLLCTVVLLCLSEVVLYLT